MADEAKVQGTEDVQTAEGAQGEAGARAAGGVQTAGDTQAAEAADGAGQQDQQVKADPEERLAHLLDEMPARRPVLLAVLRRCVEPCTVDEIDAYVSELQAADRSVYGAASLCTLLEEAGGLELVTEDGTPFEELSSEPQTVVVDGVAYLEPRPVPERFWRTTDAGAAIAAQDDPDARLHELLDEEPQYAPIYERVLTMCLEDGGATTKVLADAVDKDPLVQEPRRWVQYFLKRLEDCEALVWGEAWSTTELGERALEELAAR